MQQFSQTSSIFKVGNIKNEAILQTSFNNGKLSAELAASYQCVLRFFRSKYDQRPDALTALMNMSLALPLPRKMHLCRSSSNVPRLPLFLEMLQNPHVLLTFDTVHNPLRLPHERTSERQKVVRACCVFYAFDFDMCFAPQRRTLFRHLNFQKWSEPGALCTLKYASRRNGVHFFDSATFESAPELRCFAHFDLEMCFAPQRRAIFHLSSGQLASHPPL